MKNKIHAGKTRIIIMLVAFIVVLVFVGVLMQSKMQTLMGSYVEKQVTEQAKILAELLEENLTSELDNLEEIAWYIESETADMDALLEMAEKDGNKVQWGVLELGGNAVYGEQLDVKEYSGIQDSFRGNKAVSYKQGRGLLFTVPVYRSGNIKYVLYKLIDESLLRQSFGISCYDGAGRVLVATREDQIAIPYLDWKDRDAAFFERKKVQETFAAISEKMNIATAAAGLYSEDGDSRYIFVAEIENYDFLLVGTIAESVAAEGLFYVVTLTLWVFGLLLLLLAIGMAFLFGAEEKAQESDALRQAKILADSANQAKTDFLASMSHEIRTPINAVMGMNEMILRECEQENIKEYAVNIQSASKTLLSLINDILDLSKIEAGKMEILEDNYYLSSVLNNVVNMIQVKANQKKLDFHVEVDETIPDQLYGDEVRIRQVLVNILNNAVKYTKTGGVWLKVEKEVPSEISAEKELMLKIAVKDTGIGIKEEDMEKLFKEFERLDSKVNRNVEGTGLGLAITSRMLELMHGRLEVESTYGEGTIFTIFLPQKVMREDCIGNFEDKYREYIHSINTYEESFTAPKARILVVDDNEMNLLVVEKLLAKTQVQITCCDSGENCLELVKENAFDVIFLDHMMPDMDGIETLRHLKVQQDNQSKAAVVIALTANAILGVREMYISEGFDDYLSKPIDGKELEEILRKYIPAEKINQGVATESPQIVRNSNSYQSVAAIKEEKQVETKENKKIEIETETKKVKVKGVEQKEAGSQEAVRANSKWKVILERIAQEMFPEEMEIQYKLLNLILSAAFVGGIVSWLISLLIGANIGSILTVTLLICVVGFALWLANKKKKRKLAALITVITANMIIFPVMYFTSGGMNSGMPVWLVLGMIFSWLILTGRVCFIVYIMNAFAVVGCILLEMYYPELVLQMESRGAAYGDLIQSILIVTCIFGAIFKYQTYVYEKQKKQILKANQVKNEFLANMSHEIRTPINAILGYNDMILKESRESQTATYAMNVQAAGRTLLSQVNDILDFTNMEKSVLHLKKEPYSVLEILQDVITYAEYNAEQKGLELRVDIDETIPNWLAGDAVRLTQILDNLISNAVKYTREGYIQIAIKWGNSTDSKGTLWVKIQDTGIGMKEEDIQKISESFVRFDKQQTSNVQGMGLGLTIVTRLLHFMGSSLEVQSKFGKGSTFSFAVEQEIVDATPIGIYEKRAAFNSLEAQEENWEIPAAKLLIVDDNHMNLDLLKGMLKNTKAQIDSAMNGQEALELVRKGNYHLILMDHMMPIMDGIEALHKMRADKLCEGVPIIVLTANAVGNAREEYLQQGFDDYLSKPIHYGLLMEVLKQYLPEEVQRAAEASEVQQEEPFLSRLSFLDTATGMGYCCESEDFYKEMLNSYLSTNKYQELCQLYQEEKWDKYRILVHALKSTSLSIGAVAVSEDAKQLEMAAKEERVDYIRENHDRVMMEYKKLLDDLRQVLENKSSAAEEVAAPVEEVSEVQEHILIVDDDPMNLRVAEKLLQEMYRIDCVKSGQEALEFLQKEIPNLILLDLHMPGMDGFTVIKEVKKQEKLREIPVIFLTADNDRDTEVKGFREGALDFITKPFVADIMLQRVKRILELDRLQKNLQQEVGKQTRNAEARRKKVEKLSLQIMVTLANTIDAKDKYTNGHSLRVAEYAREMAKRLGKSEQEQEDIYYIGLLHDIGKIGIPNQIINKTSRLTDEEYDIIKSHPRIGADILENMTEIPGLSIGAHWHHEMYNGKGYPDGLAGTEIPEIARIIGVADAYDAMTSKRSYRDVLPQDVVREEIAKGKGTQFDPAFADIMIAMIDEDREYQMHE